MENSRSGASGSLRGTMDATTVHPREVFQEAIRWGAYAIMVAHNHPSGDPTPSSQDAELTRKLVEVSRIMAIFFI